MTEENEGGRHGSHKSCQHHRPGQRSHRLAGSAVPGGNVIGLVVLIYLYARHPSRLPEMRQVFADEPVAAAAGSVPSPEGA
jgi:hypothetical protein